MKQSLKQLIKPLDFDWVNSDITEDHFPVQPEDSIAGKRTYKVFNFGKSISSENAIAEMAKENFRPATLRELLKWGVKNWNGKDWVVALRSVYRDLFGRFCVPVLGRGVSERGLNLNWFEVGWSEDCRFLAVRESPGQESNKNSVSLDSLKLEERIKEICLEDLRLGFGELFRVLKKTGVLIFKWSESDILIKEVLALTPVKPLFGHPSGKAQKTHWIIFMKL